MDPEVQITFAMPPAGDKPSEYRHELVARIRDAIAAKAMAGELDMALADEAFRALPLEAPRQ
jgi:hypothetical protein